MQEEGFEVSRESVLAYADLNDDSATLLTRTLKRIFLRVSTRRRKEDGVYPSPPITVYCGHVQSCYYITYIELTP